MPRLAPRGECLKLSNQKMPFFGFPRWQTRTLALEGPTLSWSTIDGELRKTLDMSSDMTVERCEAQDPRYRDCFRVGERAPGLGQHDGKVGRDHCVVVRRLARRAEVSQDSSNKSSRSYYFSFGSRSLADSWADLLDETLLELVEQEEEAPRASKAEDEPSTGNSASSHESAQLRRHKSTSSSGKAPRRSTGGRETRSPRPSMDRRDYSPTSARSTSRPRQPRRSSGDSVISEARSPRRSVDQQDSPTSTKSTSRPQQPLRSSGDSVSVKSERRDTPSRRRRPPRDVSPFSPVRSSEQTRSLIVRGLSSESAMSGAEREDATPTRGSGNRPVSKPRPRPCLEDLKAQVLADVEACLELVGASLRGVQLETLLDQLYAAAPPTTSVVQPAISK
uniref:PH domain-containing protein n=1 Tax=Rhizochromulina marina TaxID=1034831 RepID=A0A7S2W7D3_9STRA|mmetsp:Transcript_16207/g.47581  ORF Transcript_16207/g.47581 Transcript_16207/m.47581 type:complete len:392 (+) Transcript_16207:170-1345(+)